jgi:DNA-binding NtrC family response regulator
LDKSARIIVIDDDENIRSTLQAILVEEGYIVDLASTGKEAIEKTGVSSYNVALIDIRLPDIEGVELLAMLKDTVPKIRKVIITGYPTVQNAITALNKNADAYMTKPVDIEKLLTTIKGQLMLQEEEKRFSEQKIAEFIQTRVKELSDKR